MRISALCVFISKPSTLPVLADVVISADDLAEVEEGEEAPSAEAESEANEEGVLHEGPTFADELVRPSKVPVAQGSRTVGGSKTHPFMSWRVQDAESQQYVVEVPHAPDIQESESIDPEKLLRRMEHRPAQYAHGPEGEEPARPIRIKRLPDEMPVDPIEPAPSTQPQERVKPDRPHAREDTKGWSQPAPVTKAVRTPNTLVAWPERSYNPTIAPLLSPVPVEFIASSIPEGIPGSGATNVQALAEDSAGDEANTNHLHEISRLEKRLFIGASESVYLWADSEASPVRLDSVVNRGTWTLSGDNVDVVVNDFVLNDGFMTLVNGASFTKPGGAIVNNGTLLIDGGSTFTDKDIINATSSDAFMAVRDGSVATATKEFVAGSGNNRTGLVEVSGNSTLNAAKMILGKSGTGLLFATNSVIQVDGELKLGEKKNSVGEMHLVGSSLEVGGEVKLGEQGTALLTAAGSSMVFEKNLQIAGKNGSSGSLVLDNSMLDIEGELKVAEKNGSTGAISIGGGSVLAIEKGADIGGHKNANASVVVHGASTLDVGEKLKINEASAVSVSGATLVVAEEAEVKGTLSLTGATALLDDKLTLEGSLLTEDSLLSIADDFELKKGSSVIGGVGDVYEIGGDFKSEIELVTDFDLSDVTVSFVGPSGTEHKLTVAGVDVGASPDGFVNNYAFGGLHLGSGQVLVLEDKSNGGAALYVGAVQLDDGISQLANIGGDPVVLYYDASLPENAYLNGETYELGSGNGSLAPGIILPEPGTLSLLFLALVLIGSRALYRRRH